MKFLKKIIYLLIIGLCFTACTKEISLNSLVEEQNKIVVNGLINNTQPLSATVTKGFQYEKGKTTEEIIEAAELKNAQVAIYENGMYVEDMVYQKSPTMDVGEFTASFLPKIGATYRIETQSDGLADASAVGAIPEGVDIANASVKFGGGNSYPFSFTLNDAAEKNYYYLKMYFNGFVIDSLTNERIDKGPFVAEIPEGALPEAQRYLDNGYLFKDDSFNGKSLTISGIAKAGRPLFATAAIDQETRELMREFQLDTSRLHIRLETLSEEAYKFHNSNAKASPLNKNTDFLNEVTAVYGNVENGLGIFAGIYISEVGVEVE